MGVANMLLTETVYIKICQCVVVDDIYFWEFFKITHNPSYGQQKYLKSIER